ncbi:unnamed protein product [Arctogadus glacialis]
MRVERSSPGADDVVRLGEFEVEKAFDSGSLELCASQRASERGLPLAETAQPSQPRRRPHQQRSARVNVTLSMFGVHPPHPSICPRDRAPLAAGDHSPLAVGANQISSSARLL